MDKITSHVQKGEVRFFPGEAARCQISPGVSGPLPELMEAGKTSSGFIAARFRIMHSYLTACFDVVFCQSPGYHNSPLGYPWPVVPTGKLRAVSMARGAAPSSKLKTGGLISSEYSFPVSEHHTGA
ncbi:hypothetical protein [Succinimonas amylolytica]|uniref:hypothetical protein n=1 Tax=Succinimonas amylolytica TaxID=83769 RepID=UPI0023A8DDCD